MAIKFERKPETELVPEEEDREDETEEEEVGED